MQLQHVAFSGQHLIEAYGEGGFRLSDGRHEGSVLLLPEGVETFSPRSMKEVDRASLAAVAQQSDDIDIFILGSGQKQIFASAELQKYFIQHNIALEVMDSGAACRTYNILVSEGRKVAAAIIAV